MVCQASFNVNGSFLLLNMLHISNNLPVHHNVISDFVVIDILSKSHADLVQFFPIEFYSVYLFFITTEESQVVFLVYSTSKKSSIMCIHQYLQEHHNGLFEEISQDETATIGKFRVMSMQKLLLDQSYYLKSLQEIMHETYSLKIIAKAEPGKDVFSRFLEKV